KPVVGANLRPTFLRIDDRPGPETSSGAGGQFLIKLPRPDAAMRTLNGGPTFPWLIASAPGFGPVLKTNVFKTGKDSELTFRLVKDGPPIEGRIVDLEGRPVAEAQVKLEAIWFPIADRDHYEDTGDLSDWLKVVQQRGAQGPWDGLEQLRASAATKTGPDGRFRLAGIGRERVAHLRVSGPTVTTTEIFAMTRNGSEVQAPKQGDRKGNAFVLHSPRFEQALAPTQPIEGIVRDKDTGKPVAGVVLRGGVTEPPSKIWVRGVETTSDAQGRYRLAGLPKSPSYQVFVVPGPGLPYPNLNVAVPAMVPGLNPVPFDLTLTRGVVVRGRVTDKATGRPVLGYVEAFTFSDNPWVAKFPGYRDGYTPQAYLDEDGRYELVTLPGHGIIACRSDRDRYVTGIGADTLKGVDAKLGLFSTLPFNCHVGTYHILADVDLTPTTTPVSLDLQVDPGRMIALKAVDPEGNPVAPTKVLGLSPMFIEERLQESSSIEVHGLDLSKPLRRVTIVQTDRKLVGEIALKGDESGPINVRLQPWGTILGRVIGEDGAPRVGLRLSSIGYLSTGRMEPEDPRTSGAIPGGEIYTDGDGRFRIERVVPGLVYSVSVAKGTMFLGDIFRDVKLASGETKDLGDLKVVRPEVLGGPKPKR
ncbi:carboxypeptidase regulatory-like domain-containing protein, partial [Singulisphaera rosea]